MRLTTIAISSILFGFWSVFPFTAFGEQNAGGGTIDSYQNVIDETWEGTEEALYRKKLGDAYVLKEDYQKAAEEFIGALSLKPSAFSVQDRVQMAVYLSWADRLEESIKVLRDVLMEDPDNHKARIELSKVLSWSDKLKEAGAEADQVLNDEPNNQEILIIKANVLRWQGDAAAAIPVYEKALAQGENFDAGIGLAYAYLDIGEKKTAKEIRERQKPRYPYQEKELAKFADSFCSVRASRVSFPYSYYKDSDDNRAHRSGLSYGFWFGRWDAELSYRLTDATDPVRQQKEEYLWITTRSQMGRIGTGAGVGISRTDDRSGNVLAGHLRADASLGWGTIDVGVLREAFAETAQLIENRIIQTSGTIGLSEVVSPRLTFTESYTRSDYSDSNNADDFRLGAKYLLMRAAPKITTGYRFRYWNFRRQSGGGYFDPKDLTSHQVFVSLYAEKRGFYVSLGPYAGLQSFTRNGENTSDRFYGGTAAAGWNMRTCTSFEINGEGGNFTPEIADAWRYYLVGFRLTVYF
jgi:tetratricopeptide (TPR) repeat protein